MLPLTNIRSLTEFVRNSKSCVRRLEKSGEPEVLTVNGRAKVVVQDAASYQKLLDAAEMAQTVSLLQKRLDAAKSGTAGIPADQVLAKMKSKLIRS